MRSRDFPRAYGDKAVATRAVDVARTNNPSSRANAAWATRAGIGLKPAHFRDILERSPEVGFFEIHAENYFVAGGPFHHYLERIRSRYPLSIHGVGLSLGGSAALDEDHLDRLTGLVSRYEPAVVSEHLAWSTHASAFFNDLLPVPYDTESLQRVCEHMDRMQTRLRRRVLLENPSTYVEFEASTMSEAEFLGAVVARTGCGLLLDVNNAYVSAVNHGRDAWTFIEALPLGRVQEIHLAGFTADRDGDGAPLLIDSHGAPVDNDVWALYERVSGRLGRVPTLIEWDNDIPALDGLVDQATQADRIATASAAGRHAARRPTDAWEAA